MDLRPVEAVQREFAALAADGHVVVAGRDVDVARLENETVLALIDGQSAFLVEPDGEEAGEVGGDVLHDDDGRQGRLEAVQHVGDGVRPARRGADGDELDARYGLDLCWEGGRSGRRRRCCLLMCGTREHREELVVL